MINNKRISNLAHIVLILLLLSGCKNKSDSRAPEETIDSSGSRATISQDPPTISGHVNDTFIPQATIDHSTPTHDLRISEELWRDWPIIPEVTNNAIVIYASGIQTKVNSRSFSKTDDCQNIKESFLGIYDLEGRYFLGEDEGSWHKTIDNFKGYINKDGMAIEQGLNVAASLSPLHVYPNVCNPSESPLQCELREANSSFAFISFERW